MRITRILCLALLGIAVGGCDVPAPRSILSRQCVPLGSAEPTNVGIRAPADGTVRVGVEPRGIAVVASIPARSGIAMRATSPVDRLGLITLLAPADAGETIAVRIESRDWREIRAEVCVDAVLLRRSDVERARAERAFSQAGAATLERDWQRAFDRYDAAARGFARLGLNELSGAARHAMAELAYQRLRRESDAIPLAVDARRTYGKDASAAVRGALAALEARAAVEVRDVSTEAERAAVAASIDAAQRLLAQSRIGAREALRLRILQGFLAYRADSPQRAEQLFIQAMEECAAARDWECHGIAAQNLALLAEERESFAVALDTFEEAGRHVDPAVAPELAADLLDNLGRLQRVAGLVAASDTSHASALRLYARLENCDSVRRTLARIGTLHAQVGSFDDAIVELQRAASSGCKELIASLDDRGARAPPGVPAVVCAKLLDANDLSADGKLAVLQAVLALEGASLLTGDVAAAERCLTQAHRYAATSRGQVRTSNARGDLLLEQRHPAEARAAFEEARRIADTAKLAPTHEHRGRTLLGLARASLLAGDEANAQLIALQALGASAARSDVGQAVESLRLLADGFRAEGELDAASRTLHLAAGLIERVPIHELDGDVRATYLAAQHAVFAELTELLASTARSEAAVWTAFGIAERGRARSFKYALSQTETRGDGAGSASSADTPDEFLKRVSQVYTGASADSVADFVRRLDELGADATDSLTMLERRALQQRLARLDGVLVQYAIGQRTLFAFVVDEKRIRVLPLGDRDDIAARATRLAERLRDHTASAASIGSIARDLAERVWWPIAPLVRSKRILVAPDDALHLVPFAMLPWSAGTGRDLVVHRAELVTAPSALFIATSPQLARNAGSARGLTLIGDPVFRRSRWNQECRSGAPPAGPAPQDAPNQDAWTEWLPSLPASRKEVLTIADIALQVEPQRRVETLLGCQATSAALRRAAREGRAVLHIATHGRIDARRPRLSALALTSDAGVPHDASFALLDILDLELAARLVTLSACDTSRGRLLRGEGVLGPAQAFLQAGASSVVASYWRVEDETTARFMRALYGRLLGDNMSIAEALRLTQLAEQTLGTSYSWAAFALYGQPDTRI